MVRAEDDSKLPSHLPTRLPWQSDQERDAIAEKFLRDRGHHDLIPILGLDGASIRVDHHRVNSRYVDGRRVRMTGRRRGETRSA